MYHTALGGRGAHASPAPSRFLVTQEKAKRPEGARIRFYIEASFFTLGKNRLVTPMGKGIYQRHMNRVVESFDHIIQAFISYIGI